MGSETVEGEKDLMVWDVVQKGFNPLLKTKLISLGLYQVRIHLFQRVFSFVQFVQRGAVLLVLILV